LEDQENLEDLAADLKQKIEALLPGVREKLHEEKLSKFPADVREAIRTPKANRTHDQMTLASEHEYKTEVGWDEVADQAAPDKRVEVKRLANELIRTEGQINAISTQRMTVNYEYWRVRGLAEPEEDTLEARRLTYEAGDLVNKSEIFKAIPVYEEAWKKWRQVIDRFPRMAGESVSADELVEDINRYRNTLAKVGKKFPQPFILQDVIDISEQKVTFSPEELAKMEREATLKARESRQRAEKAQKNSQE
jgi:hypothetical protein